MEIERYNTNMKNTWCPGCGNFGINMALKQTLVDLKKAPSEVFISFDIGCNGNGGDDIEGYRYKGLHGRSIPLAVGAHLANRKFTVIAEIGDGGCLHEGVDHLIHGIRSNYDITVIIHNNQNFALTTGQATSTTQQGKEMYAFPDGKPEGDINIGELVLSLNPTFYAKGYSGEPKQLCELIKEGIKHKGFSVIEVMQLCPTYNPECTPEFFKEKIKYTEPKTTISDAVKCVKDTEYIYTGIIYRNIGRQDFYSNLENRKKFKTEFVEEVKNFNIKNILARFE